MEAIYQDLNRPIGASISFLHVELPHFVVPWHYHPDIEILLVTKGEGRRIVGDHIENYYPGDLCILGSNLPHVWKNDPSYYQSNPDKIAECLVIHFRTELFGDAFWQLPEMQKTASFLNSANRGIKFTGDTRDMLAHKIKSGFLKNPEERLSHVLDLLYSMAQSEERNFLASSGFTNEVQSSDGERFQRAIEYIALNYQRPILLEEIAEHVHLTPTAFCRYFKERTDKTFLQYLNHYRIGLARRLLIEGQLKIQEVAFECGFGNLSHFNKHFKKLTGITPKHYRIEHQKGHYQLNS
ncbi:helix-turn-helix domain-containing protein [Labilibacter sediminis]|nr:helix-turn-helix domain-containing protein [Labilibacter sediminis]